jgi:putative hemolysin
MLTTTKYRCTIATTEEEVIAAQQLRFQVFNLELEEGLEQSYLTQLDRDQYDQVCDHLIVRDDQTGAVVGTYRFQTGLKARAHFGYYSEQEFDLSTFENHRSQVLELGRACIHRDHRNLSVLNLLWKEIAQYAKRHQLRYLIGCSSLTSQDPAYGLASYQHLAKKHLVDPTLQTPPLPKFECRLKPGDNQDSNQPVKIPKLLGAYLLLGAKIGGAPAIDREFKTIDFLTILDIESLPLKVWRRFLS